MTKDCSFNHFLSLTLKADPPKSWQEQFPLIVGSITASLVFIIAVVVIAIVCLRSEYNPSRKHSIYDKQVRSIWKHYTQWFQMSALIACPLRDHWALSGLLCHLWGHWIPDYYSQILNAKQLCPKHCFAHWKQRDRAAVGFDRHSDLTAYLAFRKRHMQKLICWDPVCGKIQLYPWAFFLTPYICQAVNAVCLHIRDYCPLLTCTHRLFSKIWKISSLVPLFSFHPPYYFLLLYWHCPSLTM